MVLHANSVIVFLLEWQLGVGNDCCDGRLALTWTGIELNCAMSRYLAEGKFASSHIASRSLGNQMQKTQPQWRTPQLTRFQHQQCTHLLYSSYYTGDIHLPELSWFTALIYQIRGTCKSIPNLCITYMRVFIKSWMCLKKNWRLFASERWRQMLQIRNHMQKAAIVKDEHISPLKRQHPHLKVWLRHPKIFLVSLNGYLMPFDPSLIGCEIDICSIMVQIENGGLSV